MSDLTALRSRSMSFAAVRGAVAELSAFDDGAVNDLDRLAEDLGLNRWDRLELQRLLEASLGEVVDLQTILRAETVADLMNALGYRH